MSNRLSQDKKMWADTSQHLVGILGFSLPSLFLVAKVTLKIAAATRHTGSREPSSSLLVRSPGSCNIKSFFWHVLKPKKDCDKLVEH